MRRLGTLTLLAILLLVPLALGGGPAPAQASAPDLTVLHPTVFEAPGWRDFQGEAPLMIRHGDAVTFEGDPAVMGLRAGGPGAPSFRRPPEPGVQDPSEQVAILMQLRGPTALDLYVGQGFVVGDDSGAAARVRDNAFNQLAKTQSPARAFILAQGGQIVSTYDAVMNGFLIQATPEQILALTRTPGVERIYRAPYFVPLLDRAVPQIGADRVAAQLGFTGKGVNVAIIDTGIDYTHKTFGGGGHEKDYRENDPSFVEPRSFPTEKVVGGNDFAGTQYTGGNVAVPDGDPLDEARHGSHVSGIVAGTSLSPNVHSGVAPDAKLVALKVFGAQGGTNVANDAIEWAVESNLGRRVAGVPARVDVINMSLGSDWAYGITDEVGVVRRAVEEAGIILVASAGNAGDTPFITGAPAAAPYAISVASTHAGGERVDKIQALYDSTTEDIEALEADPDFSAQIDTLGEVRGPMAYFGRGCDGDQTANDIKEKIALIGPGTCSYEQKVLNAAAGGAVAAVIYSFSENYFVFGADAVQATNIPAFMVAFSSGERLRTLFEGGKDITVVMSSAFKQSITKDFLGDTISNYSSRGPARNGEFKPNIAAPGSNIKAPAMGTGDKAVSFSGTSMAGPMVAGAAAVLVERLRAEGLTPPDKPLMRATGMGAAEAGAMLINYAAATVWRDANGSGNSVPLARGGSGRVDIWQAAKGNTVVTAGSICGINFGMREFTEPGDAKVEFKVRNLAKTEKRYKISTAFLMSADEAGGIAFTPSREEMTVPAGQTGAASVYMNVTPEEMKRYPAYGGANALNVGALTDAEFDAHLVVTEVDANGEPLAGGDVARVPIYLLPRPASGLSISPDPLKVKPGVERGAAQVTNNSGGWGQAELFALVAEDETELRVDDRLDVDQVGARIATDERGNRNLEIAVHTKSTRQMPLESEILVFLDFNRDGVMEWMVSNDYRISLYGGGQQRSVLRQLSGNQPVRLTNVYFLQGGSAEFANVNLDSRTTILPVSLARVGRNGDASVAFNMIVVHQPTFPDLRGSSRNDPFDQVPEGAISIDGTGALSINDDKSFRIGFDQNALGFDFDRWSLPVDRGQTETLVVTRKTPSALPAITKVLAVYPMNMPRTGDTQVLTLVDGEVDAPTPKPSNTPLATNTPRPVNTLPPPVATPTRQTIPFPTTSSGKAKIFLPKLAKD